MTKTLLLLFAVSLAGMTATAQQTADENTSTVVAYLWSGSWSQADVPVNISGSPRKVSIS